MSGGGASSGFNGGAHLSPFSGLERRNDSRNGGEERSPLSSDGELTAGDSFQVTFVELEVGIWGSSRSKTAINTYPILNIGTGREYSRLLWTFLLPGKNLWITKFPILSHRGQCIFQLSQWRNQREKDFGSHLCRIGGEGGEKHAENKASVQKQGTRKKTRPSLCPYEAEENTSYKLIGSKGQSATSFKTDQLSKQEFKGREMSMAASSSEERQRSQFQCF